MVDDNINYSDSIMNRHMAETQRTMAESRLAALLQSDHDEICRECKRVAESGAALAEVLDLLAAANDEITALKQEKDARENLIVALQAIIHADTPASVMDEPMGCNYD